MIPFSRPSYMGNEIDYMRGVIEGNKLCGDGNYTRKCSHFFEKKTKTKKCLLTTSGTHALDMSAWLLDIQKGDEIILPSFTFSSTANAFAMRGARLIFIDIRPDTLNMDEQLIESAITNRTKVIVPVHYAGVGCEMDVIMDIAHQHKLEVVEDAAQAVNAFYKGRPLGTIGRFGCYSFHETKNYTMGEGGALLINNEDDIERAEVLREKGTNRSKFYRGEIDKYTWVDIGSSYLPSELNAAYLWPQLERFDVINDNRLMLWKLYYKSLKDLEDDELLQLPSIPNYCAHNGHIFYIKTKDIEERQKLIDFLILKGVSSVFHYVPLHSAAAGRKYGEFRGQDVYTTKESERILRLPMYYRLEESQVEYITDCIKDFYKGKPRYK